MFRPGPFLVRLAPLLAAVALLVPLVPRMAWVLGAATLTLLVATAIEALRLRRVTLALERPSALALSLGQTERVVFLLHASGDKPLHLVARQTWPDLVDRQASSRVALHRPGEVVRLAFDLRAVVRGSAPLAPLYVAASRFGLAERIVALESPAQLTVFPNLKAITRLHGKLNRYALRGLGSRMSARIGKGRDFDRLREYVLGDDLRDLAWKSSARHGKLIVREYRLDRSQDVLLCLDCGNRMAARVAHLTKLDHAVNGAMLLAYLCNRVEDRVGVLSFATSVIHGPRQGKGGAHLRQIAAFSAAQHADYLHSDYLALAAYLRGALRHRTLVVVFTSLAEIDQQPLLRAMRAIGPPHLPLVVILSDPDLTAAARTRPASKQEACRTLVASELLATRERTARGLRRRGALVVETAPTDAGLAAINAYIEVKRQQLL